MWFRPTGWFKIAADGARPGNPTAAERELVAGTSEYASRVAESVYSVALQALLFVYASAPAASLEEAATLGPEWTSPETLFDLQVRPDGALVRGWGSWVTGLGGGGGVTSVLCECSIHGCLCIELSQCWNLYSPTSR